MSHSQSSTISQPLLGRSISSSHARVRSKACNLLGNLCKHSDAFYASLCGTPILPHLAERCADADAEVRKFACFAVGNASFHSSCLYAELKPCIEPLVACLDDADPKTCAVSMRKVADKSAEAPSF